MKKSSLLVARRRGGGDDENEIGVAENLFSTLASFVCLCGIMG